MSNLSGYEMKLNPMTFTITRPASKCASHYVTTAALYMVLALFLETTHHLMGDVVTIYPATFTSQNFSWYLDWVGLGTQVSFSGLFQWGKVPMTTGMVE